MSSNSEITKIDFSLRNTVKQYLKRAQEIEAYLVKHPKEWGKFQVEFNAEVNGIFQKIMNFEKNNLSDKNENKVYKLKQLFIKKFRWMFLKGAYCEWSLRKPYGYAGDFKIIDDIYQNEPPTNGFDRLFDNYFQMSAISVAVRNRKDDFKRIIRNLVASKQDSQLRIMDLASGPCREIKELLTTDKALYESVVFDCYDNDQNSINYAKGLLGGDKNVNFIKENAIKIALKKDIASMIPQKFDLIYSTGLFDYFNERLSISTVSNLKKLLKPNGVMAIATVRDKYSNPSVHFMEWVGEWNLVYRDDENFKKIFMEAGFKNDRLETQYEQQGILQYIIATQ